MSYSDKEKQRAFQRKWQVKKRLDRKKSVIEMLGGECVDCGYKENIYALQIDHIIALRRPYSHKISALTSGSNLIAEIFRGKVNKKDVQLLCANCHCIKTYKELHLK